MSEFSERMEQALSKAPLEDKTDSEGRTFMPSDKFYKLPAAERENHWTLQARDVIYKRARVLATETSQKIKDEEERLTKFAELAAERTRQEQWTKTLNVKTRNPKATKNHLKKAMKNLEAHLPRQGQNWQRSKLATGKTIQIQKKVSSTTYKSECCCCPAITFMAGHLY